MSPVETTVDLSPERAGRTAGPTSTTREERDHMGYEGTGSGPGTPGSDDMVFDFTFTNLAGERPTPCTDGDGGAPRPGSTVGNVGTDGPGMARSTHDVNPCAWTAYPELLGEPTGGVPQTDYDLTS